MVNDSDEGYNIGFGLRLSPGVEIESMSDDGLGVDVKAVLRKGRYVCTDLRIYRSGDSGQEINTQALRDIAVGSYVEWAAESGNATVEEALVERAAKEMDRPGGVTDSLLEVVAATYRYGYAVSRSPIAVVIRVFDIGRSRAARWVSEARQAGLLGVTDMRQAGGVELSHIWDLSD